MVATRTRVAVALTPRLFGDAVSVILRRADREVCVFVDDSIGASEAEQEPFDLAVVSGEPPRRMRARVVIRLPDDPSTGGLASVETASASEPFAFAGLSDVVTLVNELCDGTTLAGA